jgi:DNA invertase Pin-like site-specific DNA recombinase
MNTDWMGHIPRELWEWRCERVAEWTRAGVAAADIAARLKISKRSVMRYRHRAGVSQPPLPPLTAEQVARAQQLLDDGCSIAETARTIGCSETAIARRYPGRGWTREQIYTHLAEARRLKKLLLGQRISV